jgi:hypothetical protein
VAVTLYNGPPSAQMAMKPRQDAAAADSRAAKPVPGWDRWTLASRTDNQRYTLVCRYCRAASGDALSSAAPIKARWALRASDTGYGLLRGVPLS